MPLNVNNSEKRQILPNEKKSLAIRILKFLSEILLEFYQKLF